MLLILGCTFAACSKDDASTPVLPPGFTLSYADSILYLQNQAADYIVTPVKSTLTGVYTGFPEGIELDANTGAINVSKSEMGLRYRISFLPSGSKDTLSTIVLLSGINYYDGFYKLNTADSILKPVYNASKG